MGYYDKTSSTNGYYGNSSTRRTEPSIRNEFGKTFDGSYPEIEKSHYALLRKATLDSDGNITPCPCVDATTKEPDRNTFCEVCYNVGYYWTESYIKTYRTIEVSDQTNAFLNSVLPAGKMNIPSNVFYFKYSENINTFDKIIEIELETSGAIVYPVNRLEIYSVNFAWPYRLDNGRIEYWKVFGHKEQFKFLNKPSYGE